MQEHPTDRRVDTVLSDDLPGLTASGTPLKDEHQPCRDPIRIGYRSFDRQWIIPDKRVINRPNPTLWALRSSRQVFLTALHRTSPVSGPAATLTAEVPELDHYRGSFGGRAYPLWLDPAGTVPNAVPGLLELLETRYCRAVGADALFGYLVAVLAHPGYPKMFSADLSTPGLRVPLTGDPELFGAATEVGRRVVWLHTYGQQFVDPAAGRPRRAPRLPPGRAPKVSAGIPSDPERMPDSLTYDVKRQELRVGAGRISNVTPTMWSYGVSGVNVLAKWFSYRRKTRDRPVMGDRRVSPLLGIQPDHWHADYTRELIDLLNVLGLLIELEQDQSNLLTAICNGPLISTEDLHGATVLPVPPEARKVPRTWRAQPTDQRTLW
jgi:hypothetical protein